MALVAFYMGAWILHLYCVTPTSSSSSSSWSFSLVSYSVLLSVLGPIFEGYYSSKGLFSYAPHATHVYFVPAWLGGLYMHGALAVATTVSTVEGWRRKKGGEGERKNTPVRKTRSSSKSK